MNIKKRFSGRIPAMVTPLNDKGMVDAHGFKKTIDRMMDSGCSGVMILGTVGEGMDVDRKTARETVETAVKVMDGRGVVVVSTGSVELNGTLDNIRNAYEAGADAVLNVPPFYHKFSQQVLVRYFETLAENSPLPVMIYNMPDLVKVNVELSTIEALSSHRNIIGIKDSGGNATYFQQLVCRFQSPDFSVFMGRAPLSMIALMIGADGIMTPLSNLAPDVERLLVEAVKQGNIDQAKALIMRIQQIVTLYGSYGLGKDPISKNIKAIMSKMGICEHYTAGMIPRCGENEAEELYQRYTAIVNSSLETPEKGR